MLHTTSYLVTKFRHLVTITGNFKRGLNYLNFILLPPVSEICFNRTYVNSVCFPTLGRLVTDVPVNKVTLKQVLLRVFHFYLVVVIVPLFKAWLFPHHTPTFYNFSTCQYR